MKFKFVSRAVRVVQEENKFVLAYRAQRMTVGKESLRNAKPMLITTNGFVKRATRRSSVSSEFCILYILHTYTYWPSKDCYEVKRT